MLSYDELIKTIQLNPNIEKSIVGMLVAHGLVKYDKSLATNTEINLFKNVSLITNIKHPVLITLDKVDSFRNLFPVGLKGTPIIIHKKLQRFFNTDGAKYTFDELMQATQEFINIQLAQSGTKYIFNCNNIIYKQEKNKEEKCPILDILDKYLSYKQSTQRTVDDFVFDESNNA